MKSAPASVRVAPGLAALAGFCLTLAWFYPGYATNDTLAQYQQAISGHYDDVHPPLFAWVWRHLLLFGDGTAPLFVLVTALYWIGLARCSGVLPLPPAARVVMVLAVGLWPAALLLLGQVWKDIAMAAVLLNAAASAVRYDLTRARFAFWAALLALAVAAALRHNAWPASLPFLYLLVRTDRTDPRGRSLAGLQFALLAAAIALVPVLVNRALDAERRHVWTTLAIFDLGAIAAATGEVMLPASIAPTLSADDARRFHRSWSNVRLIESGKVRLSFFVPYDAAMRRALRSAWWNAVRTYPVAYLRHRGAVSSALLFGPPADAPRELVYSHAGRTMPAGRIGRDPPRWFAAFAAATWHTPMFGCALYLLVATALIAIRRLQRYAVILLLSGLAYAAPLTVIAVAAEFRYVFWTMLASLMAIVISLCSETRKFSKRPLAAVSVGE